MSRNTYPPIRIGPDGKRLCRGCGGPIPKGRFTWCSVACYELYEPDHIYARVWARDGGRCQMCGRDVNAWAKEWREIRRFWMDAFFEQVEREHRRLERMEPHEHSKKFTRLYGPEPHGELDHIVPYSEGGATVDENLRLLCDTCHKKRTREWHRLKAAERRGQLVLL